jgi:hypothetical protein
MPDPEMSEVALNVDDAAPFLKLTWRFAYGRADDNTWTYRINPGPLLQKASDLRTILYTMSETCRRSDQAGQAPEYGAFLSVLAEEGVRLRNLLFKPVKDSEADDADGASTDLAKAPPGCPLVVTCNTPVHLPWGFVAKRKPMPPVQPGEEQAVFDAFWGGHFDVAVRFCATRRIPGSISSRDFRLLGLMTDSEFERALDAIRDKDEKAKLHAMAERLFSLQIGRTSDLVRARSGWQEIESFPSALYIFGHCDGTAIYLREEGEPDSRLPIADFEADYYIGGRNSPPRLLFINGCRSAAGEGTLSFLQSAWTTGFRGCIATEAEVPNAFALRYGLRFMDRLCFGDRNGQAFTVGQAFRELRDNTELFPLNRLYGCYADHRFSVRQDGGPDVARAA